jgi:hypothetical protein
MRRLKPATGLWKIQPQWVVTPRKQTKKQQHIDFIRNSGLSPYTALTDWSL